MSSRRGLQQYLGVATAMCRRLALIAAACAIVFARPAWSAETDPTAIRRLLRLIHGIEQEYREAFNDSGALVRPFELEEARLLLAEARTETAAINTWPDGAERLAALTLDIDRSAPVADVVGECRDIRAAIVGVTGIVDDVVPPQPPDAKNGAKLYARHCATCHGDTGRGDGPDAARQVRRPPDFTDAAFMEHESPADFFLVISLGRRGAGMPAWEDVLSIQERWDLVSYVWFFGNDGSDAARIGHALVRVEEGVGEAVAAYRLREEGAGSLALDAYLSFEPLEAKIAVHDAAAVARVEREFVRFQAALKQGESMKEVEAAAAGVRRELASLRQTTDSMRRDARGTIMIVIAGVVAISVAALMVTRR